MNTTYSLADIQQARALGFSEGFKKGLVLTIQIVASVVVLVAVCACLWVALFI